MTKTSAAALAAALLAAGGAARAGDAPPKDPYLDALARARTLEQQLVTTVATVSQESVSVVNYQVLKGEPGREPPPREPVPVGVGSGVLVQKSNRIWVLTNQHVVQGADKIEVITSGGVHRLAAVEDTIEQYDIALLRFADKTTGLKAAVVRGRASVELEEGQWCLATGNPFKLAMDGTPVVTLGVISGLERVLGSGFLYGRAIQHDAAVNPGNSGGPLWNLKGEFVGINGMITFTDDVKGATHTNSGAAYSIPVEQIDAFLGQLVDAKKDARAGYLGVGCETETDKGGKPVGARITGLDPSGPAADGSRALRVGDVIESISAGGKLTTIRTESELINALAVCPAGMRVTISYRRLGKTASVTCELAPPH